MRPLLPLLMLACCVSAPKRYVWVDEKSPEVGKCWRECKQIETLCSGPQRFAEKYRDDLCWDQFLDCQMTCPGAREFWMADGKYTPAPKWYRPTKASTTTKAPEPVTF